VIILSVRSLSKSYPRTGPVLRSVSLDVARGECVALVGSSGAGKSTLLHCMATLDEPDSGNVSLQLEGGIVNITAMQGKELSQVRARHIGMIYQFHHILPEFTAIENVMLPSMILGLSQGESEARAKALLDRVGMLHRMHHVPSELSGGEQQRVAIARALVNEPSVLFADEPTGNLDSRNAESVADLLFDLQKSIGLTCVIATHSADLAQRCERTLMMRDGEIVQPVSAKN